MESQWKKLLIGMESQWNEILIVIRMSLQPVVLYMTFSHWLNEYHHIMWDYLILAFSAERKFETEVVKREEEKERKRRGIERKEERK